MAAEMKVTIKFVRSIDATRRKELLQDIKQAAALHGFVYLMPMTKDEHTVEYWCGDIRKPKKGNK